MALRQAARSVASLAARREGVAVRAFATNINQTYGLPPDTFKRKVRADPRPDRSPHSLRSRWRHWRHSQPARRNPKSTRDPPRRAPRRLTAAESPT